MRCIALSAAVASVRRWRVHGCQDYLLVACHVDHGRLHTNLEQSGKSEGSGCSGVVKSTDWCGCGGVCTGVSCLRM